MREQLEIVDETAQDTQKGKFLTFRLDHEYYGIEIKYVTEIIGIQQITEIPEMPAYIRGIINLRGKIIPVMDVRLRFNKVMCPYNDRTCIIVIDVKDLSVGLIVDSVSEVTTIQEEDIVDPPEMSSSSNKYVMGIGKVGSEVKLLLNCDTLLNDSTAEQLHQI
jgi:purine-binding chemotaxis protein CheW